MQVRAITVNAVDLASGRNLPGNRPQAQPGDNGFGPQCRVTISQEGRNLSRQQTARTEKGTQSVKEERMLLRRQEEAEQDQKWKEGYREKLGEIDKQISDLNSSYHTKKDKDETIEKQQQVLRAMRNQKQFQMEENQRRAKEAQQMAMQSAGYQEEIDEDNRDLLTLLKTMEEAEKAEEEQGNGAAGGGGKDIGNSDTPKSVSDVIQNSSAQFTTSSLRRAMGVEEAIDGLEAGGRWLLDAADSITRKVLEESAGIRAALDDEGCTEEKAAEMMQNLQDGMALNCKIVKDYRSWGLQILRDVRECKIQHLGDNPLGGMAETKKSMMMSAVDAAFGEAAQGSLEETSRELEEEVEELIDERNNVDRIRQDEEKEEEQEVKEQEKEEEEQGKLLSTEEADRGSL